MRHFEEIKEILSSHLDEIRNRFGVREIGIFGSYVRSEESKESDLDVLVEFEEGKKTLTIIWI
ncbi:MAG: nucleotidyltransferase domain-containing protein [Aquificaceae bacterium]|jgi:predicted nucleotidyltransferase|nr:nucleotidyltransferase domain-containing protein [Aquificaceae bacterium]